jgi:hypothetical protein
MIETRASSARGRCPKPSWNAGPRHKEQAALQTKWPSSPGGGVEGWSKPYLEGPGNRESRGTPGSPAQRGSGSGKAAPANPAWIELRPASMRHERPAERRTKKRQPGAAATAVWTAVSSLFPQGLRSKEPGFVAGLSSLGYTTRQRRLPSPWLSVRRSA